MRRYLRRLKIQAILINRATGAPELLMTVAHELGIKLVWFGPPPRRESNQYVALCSVTAPERSAAIAAGVPATSIVVDATAAELLERVAPMLVSERAPGKVANALEAQLIDALRRPLLGRIAARKFRAIESLPALRERLSRPARILCLGNGPSSEDPALRELAYDALFRVNHSWINGAHHTRPDVIFTGKRDTLDAYRAPTIFGLQTEDAASRIVLRSMLLARRFTYFTAERLGCMDFGFFAPYKPTNGAVMIATAAALATHQLIVAGIDLFSDPRGSYPGDAATPNAYTVAHDRELEARFVLETMAAFPRRGDRRRRRARGALATPSAWIGRCRSHLESGSTMSASTASNKSFKTKLHHRKLGAAFADSGNRAPGDRRKPVLVRLAPLPGTTASNKPPVRIFVGTEPAQFRAERVFVWSIKKHRDPARAYEIYLMSDLEGFDRSTWKTGFTQYRYAVPAWRDTRVARFTTTSTRSTSRIRPNFSISICAARRY